MGCLSMADKPKLLLYVGHDRAIVARLHAIVQNGEATGNAGVVAPARAGGMDGDGLSEDAQPYGLEVVSSQKAALKYLTSHPTATVVVETGPKVESRIRFCHMLRGRVPTVPIVAIGSAARASGFAFDAFLSPPLETDEVRRVLLAIRGDPKGPVRTLGPIQLNIVSRQLKTSRGEFKLTPKQCSLLRLLLEQPGAVVRRADIMHTVWETAYLADTRTLDVHIHWLRTLIEPDPAAPIHLITVRGEGYKIVADNCEPGTESLS